MGSSSFRGTAAPLGVDRMPDLLPERSARGLSLRAPARAPSRAAQPGDPAHAAARLVSRAPADRAGRPVEARARHALDGRDLPAARCDGRPALSPARVDRSDDAGVVPPLVPDRRALPLFALSNLGSMLGPALYPFFFEPWFTRTTQGWIWAAGFAAFRRVVLAVRVLVGGGTSRRSTRLRASGDCASARAHALPLGRAACVREPAPALGDESAVPGHAERAVPVDPAALALPAELHRLLRVATSLFAQLLPRRDGARRSRACAT
jgi:hypothetical protein